MVKKVLIVLLACLSLSACGLSGGSNSQNNTPKQGKQLINELEISKRPFVAIMPHPTSKLLTIYFDQLLPEFKSVDLDLEYLSGNSLKGGKTSFNSGVSMPFGQAFLLGSCSSGGKCSFDTNLISGTVKAKLYTDSDIIQVLKGDYVFVNGETIFPDGKLTYSPKNKKIANQIVSNTFGLPKKFDKDLAYNPIVISTISNQQVQSTVSLRSEVKEVYLFDGNNYVSQKFVNKDGQVSVEINQVPWSKTVSITRDDLKGTKENHELFFVGPLVFVK